MVNFFTLKERAFKFINNCQLDNTKLSYKFSVNDQYYSPYALCFSKFIEYLFNNKIECNHEKLYEKIVLNLKLKKKEILKKKIDLITDKSFMQLICFSLSLLSIINMLDRTELKNIINEILPEDLNNFFKKNKLTSGLPQKGNIAMFLGIILYYKNKFISEDSSLDIWFNLHDQSMNSNGFWGNENDYYLQFQNGYHQYELYHFFKKKIKIKHATKIYNIIKSTQDNNFQFAPYFGGNSCYDYDAVFMLIYISNIDLNLKEDINKILNKVLVATINDTNQDGGYSDSKFIRPKNLKNLSFQIKHIISSRKFNILFKRLRYFLALQRDNYNEISTHWHDRSRKWTESNLWDTWFRLLLIAKIDDFQNKDNKWGFIKFPGLGS